LLRYFSVGRLIPIARLEVVRERDTAFLAQPVQTVLHNVWLDVEVGADSRRVPGSLRAGLEEQQDAQLINGLKCRTDELFDLIRDRFYVHASIAVAGRSMGSSLSCSSLIDEPCNITNDSLFCPKIP
jgi:hypothetical protein